MIQCLPLNVSQDCFGRDFLANLKQGNILNHMQQLHFPGSFATLHRWILFAVKLCKLGLLNQSSCLGYSREGDSWVGSAWTPKHKPLGTPEMEVPVWSYPPVGGGGQVISLSAFSTINIMTWLVFQDMELQFSILNLARLWWKMIAFIFDDRQKGFRIRAKDTLWCNSILDCHWRLCSF